MSAHEPLVLAVTTDLVDEEGLLCFPGYPLGALTGLNGVNPRLLDVRSGHAPGSLDDVDVLISVPHGAPLTADAVSPGNRLAAVIRVGVGYEDCDVEALTRSGVALVIPTEATRRPTAIAALTLILALATRLLDKHSLSKTGEAGWALRAGLRGHDLDGKLLGLVGCGAIGQELIALARPLGLRFAVADPALDASQARELGAALLPLDDLLRSADIVSIHCPLNASTRKLLDARRIGLLRREAFLVNTARGGVIDQGALVGALQANRIAGAGLDVFDPEPLPAGHPLTRIGNVVLSGHALNWTAGLDANLGQANIAAVRAMTEGRVPEGIVNREIAGDPRFQSKLARLAGHRPAEQAHHEHAGATP